MADKKNNQSMRDKIRQKTIGAKKQFKSKIVEIDDHLKIEVRQPSIAKRGKIMKKSKAQTGDVEKIDLAELQVWGTILCCYEPDTNNRIFDESDYNSLKNMPGGGWADDIFTAVSEVINVEDVDQTKKN